MTMIFSDENDGDILKFSLPINILYILYFIFLAQL